MNKQIRKESHLTNCHWKGMTSSIQPIVSNWVDDEYLAYSERHKGQLNGDHRSHTMNNGSHTTKNGSHTTKNGSHTMNGYREKHRDLYTIKSPDQVRRAGRSPELPRRASYTANDVSGPNGSMTLERNKAKHDPALKGGTLGRRTELSYDQYPSRAQRYWPEEDRQRETSFPARESRESRGSREGRDVRGDVYYDNRSQEEPLDRRGPERRYHTLQPRDVKEYRQYMAQQDDVNLNQRPPKSSSNKPSFMKSLFESPDKSNQPPDKTDTTEKQSIKQKWRKATKSVQKNPDRAGSPSKEPGSYSWLRTPSPQNFQQHDPIPPKYAPYRPPNVPSDHQKQRPYYDPHTSSKQGLEGPKNQTGLPNPHIKSGVMRSMSVTSLTGLVVEKKEKEDPITNYFDMEKKDGEDTIRRKKSLLGRASSLFDLFGFDDENKNSSSSSSSSEDTVREVIPKKKAPQKKESTDDQPVVKYTRSQSVHQGPSKPLRDQNYYTRDTDPRQSPKPNREQQIRKQSAPPGIRPTQEQIVQAYDQLKPTLGTSRSSKVLNNPHPSSKQSKRSSPDKSTSPIPPPRENYFTAAPLRDTPSRAASQRSLLIASAHLRQEPEERPFDRMDPTRESARSLLQRLAPQKAAKVIRPTSGVAVQRPPSQNQARDGPIVVKFTKTEKVTKRGRNQSPANKVHDEVYNKKAPNDHIFAQYGKETRRVAVAGLPIPLHQLLSKIVNHFSESLTLDMVPLKSLYIQDSQSKIFYQLDDPNDVTKGSYIKINEELVIKNIDRGSSQSLEDLANSSSSSVSSGGFVIPAVVVENKAVKRHEKSRLSLVEERLHMITNDMNLISLKSDTGSTHSAVSSQTDFGVSFTHIPPKYLYRVITNMHHNIADLRNELEILRTKEREKQAEMDEIISETSRKINEEILKIMPQGIRRRRMSVDRTEREYRTLADEAYTNIKDLEVTVDVLKKDVVKRKCRLDPAQLLIMEDQLKQYSLNINNMNEQFGTLRGSLKTVMAEELEIIVNEEQFLADEEPMLEEATVKCEELSLVMETLRRVAEAQKVQGPQQLEIYTVSEVDILEERNVMIQSIGALIPNHEERVQSIQAVEDFRAAQKKYIKSEAEQIVDEVREIGLQLRKTDSIALIEQRREEALKNLFLQQEPHPNGLGNFQRRSTKTEFNIPESTQSTMQRRTSLSKCKSMSSIAQNEDSEDFHQSEEDSSVYSEDPDSKSSSRKGDDSVKRSKSFNKDKFSDEEKSKPKPKKFPNFFGKKSKSKCDDKHELTGEAVIVDTMKAKKKVEKESSLPSSERTSSESRKSRPNGGMKKGKRQISDSGNNPIMDQFEGIPEEKGKSRKSKNR